MRRCENGAVSIAYTVLSIGENGTVDKGHIQQRGNIGDVSELGQVQKSYSHVRLYTLIPLRLSESWVK